MTKILFLVTQSEMGGAQHYIYEICRALNSEKYEVLVAAGDPAFVKATADKGELFQKLKNTRVRPVYLKRMRRTPWPWQIILAIWEIRSLLKKERPNILFLCSTTAGLLGSIAGFLYKLKIRDAHCSHAAKLKIIYRIGGWAFRDPRPWWQNLIIFWAEKITARFKDLIVVNSEYDWRIAVKKRIISPEKIIKIYNGIDPEQLNFLSREEARSCLMSTIKHGNSNIKLIGCVANFYRTKGLEYLIESIYHLSQQHLSQLNRDYHNNRSSTAIIIGGGRLRPKLENQIKKLGLENKVVLAGRIADAYKYLKAFDVFVLPSLKEGFPWIILEAMAAELPIVATKVGALPEIIDDGVNGFLARPGNSRQLAEKIKWLLENPQEAKVMGIQAKAKLVKKFSLQKMVQETEKLFA